MLRRQHGWGCGMPTAMSFVMLIVVFYYCFQTAVSMMHRALIVNAVALALSPLLFAVLLHGSIGTFCQYLHSTP